MDKFLSPEDEEESQHTTSVNTNKLVTNKIKNKKKFKKTKNQTTTSTTTSTTSTTKEQEPTSSPPLDSDINKTTTSTQVHEPITSPPLDSGINKTTTTTTTTTNNSKPVGNLITVKCGNIILPPDDNDKDKEEDESLFKIEDDTKVKDLLAHYRLTDKELQKLISVNNKYIKYKAVSKRKHYTLSLTGRYINNNKIIKISTYHDVKQIIYNANEKDDSENITSIIIPGIKSRNETQLFYNNGTLSSKKPLEYFIIFEIEEGGRKSPDFKACEHWSSAFEKEENIKLKCPQDEIDFSSCEIGHVDERKKKNKKYTNLIIRRISNKPSGLFQLN